MHAKEHNPQRSTWLTKRRALKWYYLATRSNKHATQNVFRTWDKDLRHRAQQCAALLKMPFHRKTTRTTLKRPSSILCDWRPG